MTRREMMDIVEEPITLLEYIMWLPLKVYLTITK